MLYRKEKNNSINRFVYHDKKIFNNGKEMLTLHMYVKNISYSESKMFHFSNCYKTFLLLQVIKYFTSIL